MKEIIVVVQAKIVSLTQSSISNNGRDRKGRIDGIWR